MDRRTKFLSNLVALGNMEVSHHLSCLEMPELTPLPGDEQIATGGTVKLVCSFTQIEREKRHAQFTE